VVNALVLDEYKDPDKVREEIALTWKRTSIRISKTAIYCEEQPACQNPGARLPAQFSLSESRCLSESKYLR
jgi:hypothetical protein